MAWAGFDGKAYTRDQFAAHVRALKWLRWKPIGITLHNTALPTLHQWVEAGEKHDQRIKNLQSYYENKLGWHAGPHLFISRHFINGFSNMLQPGVHSTCYNATHIGIEMVGDYTAEKFSSGDGALVRDNAVFAMALLYKVLDVSPTTLVFHKECRRDNHDCPGHNVDKRDMIARVLRAMGDDAPDRPAEKSGIVASNDGSLNLRVSAGARSALVGILRNDEKVKVLDETTIGSTKWFYVTTADGRTGWAAARFIKPS